MGKAVDHKERDHAELSASGAERWLNCSGSIALSRKAPEPGESEYAKEGTLAHECLEFLMRNRAKLPAAIAMAKKRYPIEMVEHAKTAVDYLMDRAAELQDPEILVETKVDLSFVAPEMFGTLDVSLVEDFGKLIVTDYKYGAGYAVDAEDNSQLIYYGLGIAKLYDFNFDSVEFVVIQPRAHHESGERIRSWTTDMDTLKKWHWIFKDGAAKTKEKGAKLAAGKWCRFCPAAPICPEVSTNAMKQAQAVFDTGFNSFQMPDPIIKSVPNLSQALKAADKLEGWIKRVREHATFVLQRGEKVPGFKLVHKRSQRKYIDEALMELEAQKRYGVLAFTDPKLLSPAQLEAKIKKLYPDHKAQMAWFNKNVTKESSGLTMVSDDDKRPAVNPIENAFAEVPALPAKKVSNIVVKKQSKKG